VNFLQGFTALLVLHTRDPGKRMVRLRAVTLRRILPTSSILRPSLPITSVRYPPNRRKIFLSDLESSIFTSRGFCFVLILTVRMDLYDETKFRNLYPTRLRCTDPLYCYCVLNVASAVSIMGFTWLIILSVPTNTANIHYHRAIPILENQEIRITVNILH